jgi:4-amino-4-deoxy-L-arabinose transferase-like glycosyltransferase
MTGGSSLGRFLVVAAIGGCLLRLAFGLGYWTGQPLTRDEAEYLSLARSLTSGDGFVYDEVLRTGPFVPFGRAPGYPAFLAIVGGGRALTSSVPAVVTIAQAIVGALGVGLIGLLALRLAGPSAARAAAVLAAVYPPLVWISGYALSEALFWPVGLAVAWSFDRTIASRRGEGDLRRVTAALVCGVLTGAGILIRPALLLFLPMAGLALVWRRQWTTAGAITLGTLVVLGPWTLRNVAVHDRAVLVASDGGVTFWTGNHPLAIGEGDMAANPALKVDNQRLRSAHPGLTEEEMEPVYYREALTWIAAHPADWLWLELRKVFYLIVPVGPSYTLHSNLYFAASLLSYVPLLIVAVIGAALLGGDMARTPGMWLLALSSIATALVFFPQERFRIPIIDPALILLASVALARWRPLRSTAALPG